MAAEQPSHQPGGATQKRETWIEPAAARGLQILSTEHWSLLATRALTYSESFNRVGMFFSVLSGAVISLALIAQAGRFGTTLTVAAILLLSVVIFVGLATIARLTAVNGDDLLWVMGMNRLRHAYLDLNPELEGFFVASSNDDFRGISITMGLHGLERRSPLVQFGHGLTTMPGMLSVIVSVVAGALGAVVAGALGAPQSIAITSGGGAFLVIFAGLGLYGWRSFTGNAKRLTSRFPSPEK